MQGLHGVLHPGGLQVTLFVNYFVNQSTLAGTTHEGVASDHEKMASTLERLHKALTARFRRALLVGATQSMIGAIPTAADTRMRSLRKYFYRRPPLCLIIRWSACALPMQSRCLSS